MDRRELIITAMDRIIELTADLDTYKTPDGHGDVRLTGAAAANALEPHCISRSYNH